MSSGLALEAEGGRWKRYPAYRDSGVGAEALGIDETQVDDQDGKRSYAKQKKSLSTGRTATFRGFL